ncbi:hypothetical protein ACHQM5_029704 [Ranunculus cassubicifolius]
MEDFRSKSVGAGKMQMEPYSERPTSNGNGMYDLRSYSTSYASSMPPPPHHHHQQQPQIDGGVKEAKFKKGKTSGSLSKSWSLNDPELQRKKRVASYKVYTVEGKMKGTFRKSFRWIKDRYTQVVYGWR